ncbi:MAG: SRPBCC domain-containing protein [Cohaesibacter sp.]|jgi:uncharacterized protein YndB with AHSA1/START domain|nr:SRPBCC domain-containing protein [Cohaesibacter sp.]
MNISGELKVSASPQDIWQALNNPEILKECLPNCRSLVKIANGQFRAIIERSEPDAIHSFRFGIKLEEVRRHQEFIMAWKIDELDADEATGSAEGIQTKAETTGAESYVPEGNAHFTMTPEPDGTVIAHQMTLVLNPKLAESQTEAGHGLLFMRNLIEHFSDTLRNQIGDLMSNSDPNVNDKFEEALHKAEDAVMELEQEAETAAAKGFWGGAQMWGWIALAAIVLLLMVLAN